ncbi:MAG: hypothetical protein E6Q24_21295 [Chitinophagaceae bacterium]|jgi:hypothetical protein|nr:MAG: hypothetical protein E6Q24_21295 [Chitinophagaceae bacterium]
MTKQMKPILTSLACCFLLLACAQKPNLKDIQQTVFGNLPIGVKQSEYNKQFQSIVGRAMSVTGGTKYPYFKLEKRNMLDYRLTLLYPHAFQNKDSVVTKIVFYLYQIKFPSMEVVESPATTPEQRQVLTKVAKENQDRLDFLTQEFDTRRKIDSQFLYYLPNIAQGWDYTSLEQDITASLEQKYSKPTASNTAGNEYDKHDYFLQGTALENR